MHQIRASKYKYLCIAIVNLYPGNFSTRHEPRVLVPGRENQKDPAGDPETRTFEQGTEAPRQRKEEDVSGMPWPWLFGNEIIVKHTRKKKKKKKTLFTKISLVFASKTGKPFLIGRPFWLAVGFSICLVIVQCNYLRSWPVLSVQQTFRTLRALLFPVQVLLNTRGILLF